MDTPRQSFPARIAPSTPTPSPIRWAFPFRWPQRLLGPCPGLRELNLVCWGLFATCLLIPWCFSLWIRMRHGMSCDFVYFYGIGHILNTRPSTNLYNLPLQLKVFYAIAPPLGGVYGPSPYPPFLAQFFSLFAKVPFRLAYLFWLFTSMALYLTGIWLLLREVLPDQKLKKSLLLCFAIAFSPFVMDTLANGQIASLGFFSICVAVVLEKRQKPFASGLVLSILAYKVTLLLLLLPMFAITRRFKALLGFFIGAIVLFLESAAMLGIQIWPAYLRFLTTFQHSSGVNGNSKLRHWQFVDLNSLSFGIPGGRSAVALAILAAAAIAVLLWLAFLLWMSSRASLPAQSLVWATTLTFTLILNIYVPIYDSVLVVIAVALTIGALRQLAWTEATRWTVFTALLIFAVAWFTGPVSRRYGIQPLTLLLFLFGLLQLTLLKALCATPDPTLRLDEVEAG